MKKLLFALLLCLPVSVRADTIDQSVSGATLPSPLFVVSRIPTGDVGAVGQSFTAGLSGNLTAVSIQGELISQLGLAPVSMQLSVYDVASGVPTNLLGITTISGATLLDFSLLITFAGTVPIVANTQYAIVIQPGFDTTLDWHGTRGDIYSAGLPLYFFTNQNACPHAVGPCWLPQTGWDLHFQTYVAPTPVPEPASLLLLGTGLLGAWCHCRRKDKVSKLLEGE